jgi:hypothetical protein
VIGGVVPAAVAFAVSRLPWVTYGQFRRGWVDPFASVRLVPVLRWREFRLVLVRESGAQERRPPAARD